MPGTRTHPAAQRLHAESRSCGRTWSGRGEADCAHFLVSSKHASRMPKPGHSVAQFFSSERSGEDLYEISHRIGKGSYGTVVAGRNRTTNEKVAIKHIDRVFADKADTVRIIRELRFLRLLKHPNIVAVKDVLIPQRQKAFDDIFIVTVSNTLLLPLVYRRYADSRLPVAGAAGH